VDRAATKKAQARHADESHRTTGRLSTRHRILLMKHLGSRWAWEYRPTSILGGAIAAPEQPTEADLDALIAGLYLPYVMRACVTVTGLSAEQLQHVVGQAPDTLRLWTRGPGEMAARVRRSPSGTHPKETHGSHPTGHQEPR
jgi:hypothetical protein